MADLRKQLGKRKIKEIEKFLIDRFDYFEKLRRPIDNTVKEEVDLYNNSDKNLDDKAEWEEKLALPYIYTIVQTIVARVFQAIFAGSNYLKIYVEDDKFLKVEKTLQKWGQNLLDKIKLKSRARDFVEDGLVQRTNWLELMPMKVGGRFKMDFDVHGWFNVWYDTSQQKPEDTDIFVRKITKLYQVLANDNIYFNTEEIKTTEPPEEIRDTQNYEAKHGEAFYYDPTKNNVTDRIELLEWHGDYDLSKNPENPDIRPVIFVLANRTKLIRAETVDLPTKRKKMLFPIRPVRQAKTLIAKSIPQLIKDMAYEVNEMKSLRLQNFKTLVKLLFKYNKNADIDFDEVFVEGGNAIGWWNSKDDIDIFNVPNMLAPATFMINEELQGMQQTTGAVDHVMGTTAGRGHAETASGIRTITEQALFKISMIAQNIHDDIIPFIKYYLIISLVEDKTYILSKYPELSDFADQDIEELEDTDTFDIELKDLTQRREIERSQFINASNLIVPLLEKTGGNFKEYLRQVMERFNMENIDQILQPLPEEERMSNLLLVAMRQNPQLAQFVQQVIQDPKVLQKAQQGTPPATKEAQPEEIVGNEVAETQRRP
jgi:hypothetical protein